MDGWMDVLGWGYIGLPGDRQVYRLGCQPSVPNLLRQWYLESTLLPPPPTNSPSRSKAPQTVPWHLYIHARSSCKALCIHICVHACACMHARSWAHTYAPTHPCATHAHTHACTHARTHAHMLTHGACSPNATVWQADDLRSLHVKRFTQVWNSLNSLEHVKRFTQCRCHLDPSQFEFRCLSCDRRSLCAAVGPVDAL